MADKNRKPLPTPTPSVAETKDKPNPSEPFKFLGHHLVEDWPVLRKQAPVGSICLLVGGALISWLIIWQIVVPHKDAIIASKQQLIEARDYKLGELEKENVKFMAENKKLVEENAVYKEKLVTPDFKLSITDTSIFKVVTGKIGIGISSEIRNAGVPSIAANWECTVILGQSGESISGLRAVFPEGLRREPKLDVVTSEHKVEAAIKKGWLLFYVEAEMSEVTNKETEILLSVEDINGKEYITRRKLRDLFDPR